MKYYKNNKGFTIIELCIVTLLLVVVMGGVYSFFTSQLKYQTIQEQVAMIQQNLRAAMYIMEQDIMMAGYTGTATGQIPNVGFNTAASTLFSFNYVAENDGIDNNSDGLIDESGEISQVAYQFVDCGTDGTRDCIQRTVDSGGVISPSAIADNIQEVEFNYILTDGSQSPAPADPGQVAAVRITVLASASRTDRTYTDTNVYTTPGGINWGPYNDNLRRRLLTSTVYRRN